MKAFFKAILYTPLFNLLVFLSWLVPGHSIGWAIILLTVIVRILLWAPNAKALNSQLYIRQHADELKALTDKIKDPQEKAKAQMVFYKEKGLNPLAGCLPMLIQIPLFIALYQVFITGIGDVRPDLLYSFTPHLDTVNVQFLGINLAEKDRFILPVIAAVFTYYQLKISQKISPTNPDSKDPAAMMTKQMVLIFPAMTYFIGSTLPAGLSLYFATTTLFQVFQQHWVLKTAKTPTKKVAVTVRKKGK